MGKGLLFFCCACCILVLTIINLSVGPVVSKAVGAGIQPWGTLNCKEKQDDYDDMTNLSDERDKYYKSEIEWCTRVKGMHDMEYTAFIFDIVIGFVCGLVGLLHLFDLKKDFVSNTGLIGLICGIIGFVLTFVYVIFNGLVFTSNYSDEYERDGDGIFAEVISGGTDYKCLNYDPESYFSGRAKYSDLNKKQYNYKHEFYGTEISSQCIDSSSNTWIKHCAQNEDTSGWNPSSHSLPTSATVCPKLYAYAEDGITNKDIFDRFLTALILSLVVCLANIGLALFGFLLFRTPGDF